MERSGKVVSLKKWEPCIVTKANLHTAEMFLIIVRRLATALTQLTTHFTF